MLNDLQLNFILEDFDVAYWKINLLNREIIWSEHFDSLIQSPDPDSDHFDYFLNHVLHKDYRYDFLTNFEDLLATNRPLSLELRLKMSNGKYRWFECRNLKNREERLMDAAVLLFVNIHQTKRDQYTIEENFFYYRETAEMTSTGGWYLDVKSRSVYWDDVTKKILECPRNYEPRPDDRTRFYATEHQEKVKQMFEKCIAFGKPFKGEILMKTLHNRKFWVRATGKPVYGDEQEVIGIRGVYQDIDKQKTSELNLQNSLDLIATQNSRLFNLAHIVSHELRSHSSNLSFVAQMIHEAEKTEDKLDLLQSIGGISENLEQAIKVLNEVVTRQNILSKQRKKVRFQEALDVVIASTSSLIKRENAKIVADFDELVEIDYISEYLESIFLNLITNAIKYKFQNRRPVIYIQTYEEKGEQFLEISDNGIGIDLDEHKDDLFGMYKIFHKHPEAKGIGLFITKNQVETLGGSISVNSSVGIGTSFKIKF